MEITDKKECTKCKSDNILFTGGFSAGVAGLNPTQSIREPGMAIYECEKCGERFIYSGHQS